MSLKNGKKKLDFYNNQKRFFEKRWNQDLIFAESNTSCSSRKRSRKSTRQEGFVSIADIDLESEEQPEKLAICPAQNQWPREDQYLSSSPRIRKFSRSSRDLDGYWVSAERKDEIDGSDEDEVTLPCKRDRLFSARRELPIPSNFCRKRKVRSALMSKKVLSTLNRSDDESDELGSLEQKHENRGSYIKLKQKKLCIPSPKHDCKLMTNTGKTLRKYKSSLSSDSLGSSGSLQCSVSPERPFRRSGRQIIGKNMKEYDEDEEIYADEGFPNTVHKAKNTKEIFLPVAKQDSFRLFHNSICDVCRINEKSSKRGVSPFIFCQGCSNSIHKNCLGPRSNREHLVTKIGHENFVLQCRRCIGIARKKDKTAPRLDSCLVCQNIGPSCVPFSTKKTARQEEKLREKNEGVDPITETPYELLNNAKNVLFRCTSCQRASHFEHLPPLKINSKTTNDYEKLRRFRLNEYSLDWRCKDCRDAPATVGSLVCWRPLNLEHYNNGMRADELCEDEKEYLIKWSDKSYFECTWMPGNWVWGVTSTSKRKAFLRRDEGSNMFPKWNFEEAVPEQFLRVEIVFDVRYYKNFTPKSEKADKNAVDKIFEVYVKFQGLPYDEAVWMEPPSTDSTDRYQSFVIAYNEFVAGKYFRQSNSLAMQQRLEIFRRLNFAKQVEMKEQPTQLTGGNMMPYQMEGLNWLLYNFHKKKNVILADEMGLGKTIQIIAFFAALVKNNPKCGPFLVVTPNSTCPNWRREIKKWAPKLRVVSYYGTKSAMEMAFNYEMFPENCSDLRADIVVTSFEAPISDHSRNWFHRINWVGLVVDEGQRLKNDRNLLRAALKALKVPFQVLLTGTPLQNNKRELFNLLQFLDTSIDAAKLDEEYEELTNQNIPQLHKLIRPFFLRRTKLQVLGFLPPMAQMIIPVTMSIVQKKLYKSILAKNPELIESVFGQHETTLRPAERGNLNNIVMQLRKCLCHPFLYSSAIEDRSFGEHALFRNLVDASSKFQLLEIMLPKLHVRGHRILIFSQFINNLDLIEDFLTGLDLPFQRLDGSINSAEKQKRIDEFNAPNSPLFAFLLSTRAGGVGINLATADTVLIMDPDFNPHQDIQALSRAHRIGQEKKVLVFQLMTKGSAEEKIVQIGRKKLALDKALIGKMGAKNDADYDLESILKFGAEALFNDDDKDDIRYDSASVDKLLDRSFVETEDNDQEKASETQFSFARIWANDKDSLTEYNDDTNSPEPITNFSAWDKILEQREADAALQALKNTQALGRGKRSRQIKNYGKFDIGLNNDVVSSPPNNEESNKHNESASDFDFMGVVESHDEGELSDYESSDSNYKNIRSVQGSDPMQLTSSIETPKIEEIPCHGHLKIDNQYSLIPTQNLQETVQQAMFISSSSQFYPSKPFNSVSFQPYTTYPQQFNTQIMPCYSGPQYEDITQCSNMPTTYLQQQQTIDPRNLVSHSFMPMDYPTSFTSNVPMRESFNANEIQCQLCGLPHFELANTCPNQASDIQIRLMLDKIVRLKQSPQHDVIEIILRKHLVNKLRERRKTSIGISFESEFL